MNDASYLPILGRLPSGVFVLTVKQGDQTTGMLASWVMQAGFEPPMVSLAIRQGRYLTEWLTQKSPCVLNVLRADQLALLKHFGKGFEPNEPAFSDIPLNRDPRGVPLLADSLGHLELEIANFVDSGDHRIFLATILGGQLNSEGQPLVHIRKNGAHY
ncbi:MAG TPA: flavin reductase family protein [Pirellulales bacterium]|jgi:flavin reductase (DIM6/NTAB) family NADH-FMN oxidoreductase RutF|nr:flavin reductase family protein [Pirellulales bacterium]